MTELDFLEARKCAVCGKDFAVLYPHLWRYKEPCGGKGHYRYFCSWKCLRANEKNQEEKTDMEKLKKDGTPAKKLGRKPQKTAEQVPEVKLSGPLRIKTPDAKNVEIETPETGTLADALNGMADAAADFFGACEDMGLTKEIDCSDGTYTGGERKITKPLSHSGMESCGWKGRIGRYYYDEDHGIIDFEGFGGDELSFTTDAWRIFMEELRTAAELMGVEL